MAYLSDYANGFEVREKMWLGSWNRDLQSSSCLLSNINGKNITMSGLGMRPVNFGMRNENSQYGNETS